MGMQMAKNLLRGGVPLVAFDANSQTRDVAESFAASARSVSGTMTIVSKAASLFHDASSMKSDKSQQPQVQPRAAMMMSSPSCRVVFTMLPTCAAVNSVMSELYDACRLDSSASLPSTSLPLVIVDCSTVSPSTSRHWQERWKDQNVEFLDSPVSGGVKGATDATLVSI
jgi:3-hydroxyisobutyrate dehydrogenase-like beta-hydroxyacid dehydrogenase